MRKTKFIFVMILWGILSAASSSPAQTGYGIEGGGGAESVPEAVGPVVRVYGPDALTELTREAIQEKRPDVAVETYYQPLDNKVWIEGTGGSDYMSLSPGRVGRLEAAKGKGKSVYSALCSQQKGVIQKTVGIPAERVRVERKVVYRKTCCVRTICPPPPAVFVPMVNVGFVVGGTYPVYGYRTYAAWGVHHYDTARGRGGRRPFHKVYGSRHAGGSFHPGHK